MLRVRTDVKFPRKFDLPLTPDYFFLEKKKIEWQNVNFGD